MKPEDIPSEENYALELRTRDFPPLMTVWKRLNSLLSGHKLTDTNRGAKLLTVSVMSDLRSRVVTVYSHLLIECR